MKVKYTVEYHKQSNRWVVWEIIEKEKSISSRGIYKGTRKDCLEVKKQKEKEYEQRRFQKENDGNANI